MAVLLAGGAGFIGSHMAVALLEREQDVVVADNFSNSTPEALRRVRQLTGRDVTLYECDVRDDKRLDDIFSNHNIEYIVHFAGYKAAGDSMTQPLAYYTNNLNATLSLCAAMERHGVTKLIFSSSACVYSARNPMPITENALVGECPNPYGWTKFMSEQILRDAAAAHTDWSVIMLRYFNLFGAHESGVIGDDPTGVPKNLPPFISQVAAGKHDCLTIYGDDYPTPDGSCIRDYIHIVDLVNGHIAAMRYCDTHNGAEAFNLGTGKGTSNFELVAAFEKANGLPIPVKVSNRRPGDAPVSYCSTQKAAEQLGWKAEKTLVDGCRDMWRWQRMNPNGYQEPPSNP